jgi:alpha-L-fucosidase
VLKLQPNAVIFSDAGPGVRWCGNERGTAGDPNWATVDPTRVPYPGADGPGIIDALQHGDRDGTAWRPAEVDVSIRQGWFYHPAEDERVRSVESLVDLYFTSVGRNGKLLLNLPPTNEGLLHSTDVARLVGMREALDGMFAVNHTARSKHDFHVTGSRSAELMVEFPRTESVSIIRLRENITRGQVVVAYRVEGAGNDGAWKPVSRGTTIGYSKLDRLSAVTVRRLRVMIDDAVAEPEPITLEAY